MNWRGVRQLPGLGGALLRALRTPRLMGYKDWTFTTRRRELRLVLADLIDTACDDMCWAHLVMWAMDYDYDLADCWGHSCPPGEPWCGKCGRFV